MMRGPMKSDTTSRVPALDPEAWRDRFPILDTCTYLAPVVPATDGAVLTNSAKWAHYGPGNLGLRTGLMSMERCIRSAELGTVAPQ